MKFIKKIFHKIKEWFKRHKPFYIENVETEVHTDGHIEESTKVETVSFDELPDICKQIEEKIALSEMESESVIEDKKETSYDIFTEDDKEKVANAIRPIIKNLNSDPNYDVFFNVCDEKDYKRKLKTYVKLIDENMTLDISLTQNKEFNIMISNFINNYVKEKFIDVIESIEDVKFDIYSENGHIYVKKIK